MVRERGGDNGAPENVSSPVKTSKTMSGIDQGRKPLANISAKMQSPPTGPGESRDSSGIESDSPIPVFGQPSPMRNPLRKQPNIFAPKARAPNLFSNGQSARPLQNSHRSIVPAPSLPAQHASSISSLAFMGEYMDQSFHIPVPANNPPPTVAAAPKTTFTSGPFFSQSRTIVISDDEDCADENGDTFDPDAAIRAETEPFGAPDPHMYMDPSKASEGMKNILDGAFDDKKEKSETRLRGRARKAKAEGSTAQSKSLATKLAKLDVNDRPKNVERLPGDDVPEEDDGTIEGLSVKLLPHQVEGVAWMIDREIGNPKLKVKGITHRAGILADDMGLGKTVQSVALMLTNPRPDPDAKPEYPKQVLPGKETGKGTLVVAPLALIKQWEAEIKSKVTKSHAMKVLVHHGPNRTKSADKLKQYDVVITTYQTLTSEHTGSNMAHPQGPKIGCFGVNWYRIMLDEAHSIKNRNAKSTLACCALNAWYRWCLTGTPMQNNLDELQSLLRFLRIKPYSELSAWKGQITTPMKSGQGVMAMRRLRNFLAACMKRRTKDILKQEGALNFGGKIDKDGEEKKSDMQIVKREVLVVECEFDEEEQEFYNSLQARADEKLKAIQLSGKNDYMGALVLLLRLRQVCDHPNLIEQAMNRDIDAMTLMGNNSSKAPNNDMDDLTALMGGISVGPSSCEICQVELSQGQAKDGAVRCEQCESMLRRGNSKSKRSELKKSKSKEDRKKRNSERKMPSRKRHQLPGDSEDDASEGEWIGDGSEQDINLGKAGGTDDEDADGGGESLNSVDSERSDDEEDDEDDSPPRARRRRPVPRIESENEDVSKTSDDTDSDDDDDRTDACDNEKKATSNILTGLQRGSVTSHHKPSTKVRQLLRILHSETPDHKIIVFSQFTSMLDLIEPHLESGGVEYVRYDGSMRNDAREAALHSLRTNEKVRVLLCSLKCGSLGLNLTAASRVVIMEPFWNPFVEEQAIDRVHRLNQTVDVKVFRLTMRNTVEKRILDLQERKRLLAKAAIEGGKSAGKLDMKDILALFGHDVEHSGEHHEANGDAPLRQTLQGDSRLFDGASNGHSIARDDLGIMGDHRDSRHHKPDKQRHYREHEVYGRRW